MSSMCPQRDLFVTVSGNPPHPPPVPPRARGRPHRPCPVAVPHRRAHTRAACLCASLVRLGGSARCLAAGPPGSRRRASARCTACHPAPSPYAPPVPCHLAGFGVQSRSMSAARLHSPRPWGLPTPPGFPAPWRLAYRLWGLPTARAASSAGTFSRRKETSNRKNETPP